MKCKKCGYTRKDTDDGPDWQCPNCKVAYAKAKKFIHVESGPSPKHKLKPISFAGVVEGTLVAIIGVFGGGYLTAIGFGHLYQSANKKVGLSALNYEELFQQNEIIATIIFMFFVFFVLGGYVATRIAKSGSYFNSVVVGGLTFVILFIFYNIISLQGVSTTFLDLFISFLVILLASMFGGYLGKKNIRSNLNKRGK